MDPFLPGALPGSHFLLKMDLHRPDSARTVNSPFAPSQPPELAKDVFRHSSPSVSASLEPKPPLNSGDKPDPASPLQARKFQNYPPAQKEKALQIYYELLPQALVPTDALRQSSQLSQVNFYTLRGWVSALEKAPRSHHTTHAASKASPKRKATLDASPKPDLEHSEASSLPRWSQLGQKRTALLKPVLREPAVPTLVAEEPLTLSPPANSKRFRPTADPASVRQRETARAEYLLQLRDWPQNQPLKALRAKIAEAFQMPFSTFVNHLLYYRPAPDLPRAPRPVASAASNPWVNQPEKPARRRKQSNPHKAREH